MSASQKRLESLATAVADRSSVHWPEVEGAALDDAEAALVRQLRVVASIGAAHRASSATVPARAPLSATIAYGGIVSLAALKVIAAMAAVPLLVSSGARLEHQWLVTANLSLFLGAGLLLILGGTRDERAQSLGALFIIMASAFSNPLIRGGGTEPPAGVAHVLHSLPTDAFVALALWLFVWRFPSAPKTPRMVRTGRAFLLASAAVGATIFGVNAFKELAAPASTSGVLHALMWAFDRNDPTLLYWPLLFGLAAMAIPYLVWKSRSVPVADRRRTAFFLAALVIGLAPTLMAVVATPFVPGLRDPGWRTIVGAAIYLSLVSLVPSSAYAVAVDRVVDIHLVLRATLRHRLARQAIWAISLGPVTFLLFDAYRHRGLPMTVYFEQPATLAVLGSSVAGLAALAFRPQLLSVIDRFFLRETVDYVEALSRVQAGLQTARSTREIAAVVADELERALHPEGVTVLVAGENPTSFASADGTMPSLNRHSPLVELLRSTECGIRFDLPAGDSLTQLLPSSDRLWLAVTGVQMLSPLATSQSVLFGVVGVGVARNELHYTGRDHALVAAVSRQAALQLENRWLRERSADEPGTGPFEEAPSVNWQNEPAVYCPRCSLAWPPGTQACSCGMTTKPASLPLLVRGKFRIERTLGSGGMGIVYLAVDIGLNRKVAIKTMPAWTMRRARQLEHEARAMASVLHPNLALIYGLEHWHDIPFLVVEYLERGTLEDAVRRGALSVSEVLDLGVILADVLDRLHASGVLHRDIKPSNVGYTGTGVAKLFDLGLASILDHPPGSVPWSSGLTPGAMASMLDASGSDPSIATTPRLMGTPLYLTPEALAGLPPQPSFDLWSLAVVLYEALAGRHPLAGLPTADILRSIRARPLPDVRDSRPDCPAAVAAFLADALSLVADRRPETASDMRNHLQWLRANPHH